jgi:hypothetical protein
MKSGRLLWRNGAVMRRRPQLVSILLSLFATAGAHAEIAASFDLDIVAWRATHVVVVDAKGVVTESWKGDLPVGSKIPTDAWKFPTNETIYYGYFEKEPIPANAIVPADGARRVTSTRRVFFLVRVGEGEVEVAESWKPVEQFGSSMSVSVAWIDNDQSFAIQQWMNPGPALMRPLSLTEAELKGEVTRLVDLQQDLRIAANERDPLARAERLVSFLRPQDRFAFRNALEELAKCGQPAWRVICRLLTQSEYLSIHHDLIFVAETVAGAEATSELERIVREDMRYWSRLVEFNPNPVTYNPPMSDHYFRLSACLFVLKRVGYRDPQGLVAKLRTDWEAVPSLSHLGSGDGKGRSPILEDADKILAPK